MNKYFDYAATALPNIEVIKRLLELYPKEYLFGNYQKTFISNITYSLLVFICLEVC